MTSGQYQAQSDPRGYTPTTEDIRDEWRYSVQEVDIVPGYGMIPGSDCVPLIDLTKLPGRPVEGGEEQNDGS